MPLGKSFLMLLALATAAHAAINGRFLRIENPTGPLMEWQEIEVISAGVNLLARKPELLNTNPGEFQDIFLKHRQTFTDGLKDPSQRGWNVKAPSLKEFNPWLEVDLGKETPIDELVLYGALYPKRQWADKGHRVVSILDGQRKVVWVEKFSYYDQKAYPGGIFRWKPEPSKANPFADKTIAADTLAWVPMFWLLDLDQEVLPPDANRRMQEFAERNSPAQVKALADEFFPLLESDVPELMKARTLYQDGKYLAAFEEWKGYFFAKIVKNNRRVAYDEVNYYPSAGEDLLNNFRVTISEKSIRGSKFTPGRIFWVHLPEEEGAEARAAVTDTSYLALANVFARPLFKSYLQTGKPEYLQQWVNITDDWCLNFFRDADAAKWNVKELFVMIPANHWLLCLEELADLVAKRPEAIKLIPATTLARFQLTCMDQYGPAYWRVARNNVFNHIISAIGTWFTLLPYIDEFGPGRRIEMEWRQNLARWITQGMEPDGSMTEIGDDGHMTSPNFSGLIFERFQNVPGARPSWYTPGFENRAMEYYDSAYNYVFRHAAPGGYTHRLLPLRSSHDAFFDYRASKIKGPNPLLDRRPVVHAQPEVRRILDICSGVSQGPVSFDPKTTPIAEQGALRARQELYNNAVAILGAEKPGAPKINSDWMPYTGAYYFRGGWNPKDPFLAMIAYGSKGGALPGWDEIDYGCYYTYDYNFPLMRVFGLRINGKPQNLFYPATTYKPGSKTWFLAYAEREPAPFRWHSSEHFDYGEAIYQGAYQKLGIQNRLAPGSGIAGSYVEVDFSQPALENVCAERRVIHLRKERLFVVAEAVAHGDPDEQDAPHNYSMPLRVMLTSKTSGTASGVGQLRIDTGAKLIASDNPDTPNGFLRQFTELPITYNLGPAGPKVDPRDYSARIGEGISINHKTLTANWKTTGSFALVNLLSSADAGGADPIQNITPANQGQEISGFHAELADGSQIWCQSAVGEPKLLSCGPISAVAQTLAVIQEPDGGLRGLVLGRTNAEKEAGSILPDKYADFEFVGSSASCVATPIFRPVSPVEFSPGINTFIDTQTVTLTSKTPNVAIHYTTDGTQPTLQSPLYTGPIVISESTEFAAKAWRLGADGKPVPTLSGDDFEINGTRFSVPTYGWFYKRPDLMPAVKLSGERQPGLDYDLYHGEWTKLWNRARWLKPLSSGTVQRLLELPSKQDDYFAIIYRGYLEIPTDGLYTFHAPRELVMCDNATSYDLRLRIDGQEWDLTQWWHGLGTWSVPLAAGPHRIELEYADARSTPYKSSGLFYWYPTQHAMNKGPAQPIEISGPGCQKQPIPESWLFRCATQKTSQQTATNP